MATFFIVLCVAFAVLLLALAIGGMVQAARTRTWRPVAGLVRHSGILVDLVQDEARTGDIDAYERQYQPWVVYDYDAGGTHHAGSLIATGGARLRGSDQWALRVVDRYREGAVVTVFHDPDDASKAVLEPGASRAFIGGIIAMLLLATLFVGIALMIANSPPSLP